MQNIFGGDGFTANPAFGKGHVFGDGTIQMVTDHQHVQMFLDGVSIFLIFVPLLWPIVQYYKWDPVWFGVMFLICMQLGLLLPPHGLLLMTMRGVAPPSVSMGHIFKAVVPYVVMSLILLASVFWFPAIATWLPGLIG